ncbi:MAG: hypothetical protein AAF383_22175 [Cyanobacteria bacterium P01_A01_bin.83]
MANRQISLTIKLASCLLQNEALIMFERATIFSALLVLIFFGILGIKYVKFMEAQSQANSTSATSSLKRK